MFKFLRKVTEMPWLEQGFPEGSEPTEANAPYTRKVALGVFLAVITSVFFLFVMAYLERMKLADWRPVDEPGLLWFNTLLLVVGSVAMQRARKADFGARGSVSFALLLGGVMALAFLVGQFIAWQALSTGGYASVSNPANAFFYLLTAIHGLHLAGGLYVWARAVWRGWRGADAERIRLSIELCSVYWHYLLLVWLVLFALMLAT